MLLSISLFVLASSFCSTIGDGCRQDWEAFEESCYGFGEEVSTWGDAQEMCRTAGATLAEIETSEENEFLKSQARQKGGSGYWVGGTDIFHEGTWVWLASGNLLHPFSDWIAGQPDNGQGGHEDCLELFDTGDYKWNDNLCDAKRNFICEGPVGETVVG